MKEIKSPTQKNNSQENSSLKRIGNFIKEARLSSNQSIEELASKLKIGEHQLKAIEDGNQDNLPEEVFVKAMVRRISEKLKLDADFIMKEFKAESKSVQIEEIVEEVSNKPQLNKKTKKINPLGFGVLIIISGIFGFLASSLIFNYFSESFQNQNLKQEFINKN